MGELLAHAALCEVEFLATYVPALSSVIVLVQPIKYLPL